MIEESTPVRNIRPAPVQVGWSRRIAAGVVVVAALVAAFFALKPTNNPDTPVSASSPVEAVPAVHTASAAENIFRDCPTCPLMKTLPPGQFQQGSKPDEPGALPFEMPQHNVHIAYAFAAGLHEVTVGEYSEFVADTGVEARSCTVYDGTWHVSPGITWKNAVDSQTALYPVSCVSWQDAKDYAAWLSRRTHQTYRLPSASEWEYAARAGSTAQQPWTEPAGACAFANMADQTAAQRYPGWTVAPCADKYVQSAPVGSFTPNAMGLYDMLGNVFEWTEDCWADDYDGAPTDGSARVDIDCTEHESRGGSWFTQLAFVRTAYRNRFPSNYSSTSVGFRLIREIPQ